MQYSIGEVSQKTGIPISTLRYYDREGMFPDIERGNGGIRSFSDAELESLRIIECLKDSGLSIKEISQYLEWCQEGTATLEKRRDLFYARREILKQQMKELKETMRTIDYKCWYYDTAIAAGSESAPYEVADKDLPKNIRACRRSA